VGEKPGVFRTWGDFALTALFGLFVMTILFCGAVLLVRAFT